MKRPSALHVFIAAALFGSITLPYGAAALCTVAAPAMEEVMDHPAAGASLSAPGGMATSCDFAGCSDAVVAPAADLAAAPGARPDTGLILPAGAPFHPDRSPAPLTPPPLV